MRIFDGPHRRYDPLAGEWVLVSAGRTHRPWLGREERPANESCRPTTRSATSAPATSGRTARPTRPTSRPSSSPTTSAPLTPDSPTDRFSDGLLVAEGESGICRVICFSPRHDQGLARMSPEAVRSVVDVWAAQTAELGERYPWVQVFENRGESMGASNPHPHGQIWAGSALPRAGDPRGRHAAPPSRARRAAPAPRLRRAGGRRPAGGRAETTTGWRSSRSGRRGRSRRWSSRGGRSTRLPDLDDAPARRPGPDACIRLLGRYDGLFDQPFPYSMGWHQAPFGDRDRPITGSSTPTSTRRSCARPSASSWSATSCWPSRSGTSSPEEAAERLRAAQPVRRLPVDDGRRPVLTYVTGGRPDARIWPADTHPAGDIGAEPRKPCHLPVRWVIRSDRKRAAQSVDRRTSVDPAPTDQLRPRCST